VEDTETNQVTGKLQETLQAGGATIMNSSTIGRSRLAYTIAGQRYGTYAVAEFRATPHTLPQLNHALRLVPNVLRFLIVEKQQLTAAEQERLLKAKERMASRQRDRDTAERSPRRPSSRPATPAKPKVELKDLDQKLDEILSSSNDNV
jgi:small subunit ribosomal protein S6